MIMFAEESGDGRSGLRTGTPGIDRLRNAMM